MSFFRLCLFVLLISAASLGHAQNEQQMHRDYRGVRPLGGLTLTGIRKSHTIPANMSTTGHDIVIVDEYWYSPDLSIYMIVKHNDPRTGEQIVTVSGVDRHEPNANVFAVLPTYRSSTKLRPRGEVEPVSAYRKRSQPTQSYCFFIPAKMNSVHQLHTP
jgi:hypothetical protein